ncbi:MAG: pyruvate dehydrogenase (acetyl-transferring) E1 component subunit alpha [Clostridiales bacterium]|jgi:pyruvate dehydrogenase E1 component alpha subunit|nr:pyruvate dehydrogenase (acetyl-transferring) E1 component subunit alpha [Clostridiales bacterium]
MALSTVNKYEKTFLMKLLEQMLLIRRFEEKAAQMYGLRKIGGFCHLYIGQEAVAVGSIAALDLKKDYVLTAYRDHGHALACGMDPNGAMAELYGKVTGCSKGKGGSMHFFDEENHMYGGNGIVGAHIPIAAGMAFKIKYKQEDGVVLCYFGDGAIHQGVFHETLNMAKIWNLPVIFICENNFYGMGTNYKRVSSVHDYSIMGTSYGIPAWQVNGMDVLEVYEETQKAIKMVKEEKTPVLLEIQTYRYRGHSMSDPAKYRTKEEVEEYRNQDPIIILENKMTEAGLLTKEEYTEIDKRCKNIANESVRFAEESEEPPLEAMYEDIYA